jgi:hypothetical protein
MKLKYFICFNILLITNSLSQPKLCINCKNFIKERFEKDRFGKCKAAPYIIDDNYLITGYSNIKAKLRYI